MATNIDTWIQTIGEWLRDPDLRPEKKLEMIESSFERVEKAVAETFSEKNIENSKRYFLNEAKESGRKLFRIIARINPAGIGLMQWCDEARNFTMLIDNHEEVKDYKDGEYLKRTYTLDELPKALDNAWQWYKGVYSKEVGRYNTMDIHVMAIDEPLEFSKQEKNKREEMILYWAKSLDHKSLSLHELVENTEWLLAKIR